MAHNNTQPHNSAYSQPHAVRNALWAFLSVVAYGITFILLYESLGNAIASFCVLPVVVAAWLWGKRAGFAAWILVIIVNAALFNMVGQTGWDSIIRYRGIPGTLTVLIIGIIVGYFHDFRERIRRELVIRVEAENALLQSEKNFRAMFEIASEGLHIIDIETRKFVEVNAAMCKMFGYSREELLTLSPDKLSTPEGKEKQKKALGALFSGGSVINHKGVCMRKDGTTFNALISACPIEWYGKKAVYGSIRDVSELVEYQKRLEEKNKEIMDFTHVITHDMRNPLTSLMSVCDIMQRENGTAQKPRDHEEMFSIAKQSLQYMHELVEDLLQVTQIEQGKQVLQFEKVNVKLLVQSVISKMKVQLDEKHIQVNENVTVTLEADSNALTHVFMNLIGNAINYSGKSEDPCIAIGSSVKKGSAEFFVKDNGMGIPENEQAEIFQKFKRGSRTKDIKGTGLGLSIVKGIVEAHDGRIRVQSTEGEGSTFYFSLPLKQES